MDVAETVVRFWIACDRHKREVEAQMEWRYALTEQDQYGSDPGITESEPAREALLTLQLVAPKELVDAAEAFYAKTTELGARFAFNDKRPWAPGQPLERRRWNRALRSWEDTRGAYAAVARRMVGAERPTLVR